MIPALSPSLFYVRATSKIQTEKKLKICIIAAFKRILGGKRSIGDADLGYFINCSFTGVTAARKQDFTTV